MSASDSKIWHLKQVREFSKDRGTHIQIAEVLQRVLKELTRRIDPSAIVQVRPKSLTSFSEKAIRKQNKYNDPVRQLTDVVGGRVITYTQASADKICRQIKDLDGKSLAIDFDNSVNTADRLKPEEFGYKAMHFIVQLKPPVLGVEIGSWIEPHKMEIQVCTMMQHVWAAIGHDRVYKTRLKINDSLKRRLSAISALIETAQAEFENGIVALDRYSERCMPHADAQGGQLEEMIWSSVIQVEPRDYDARRKLGDHYAASGQWPEAYDEYSKCDEKIAAVLSKRGQAAARLGKLDEAEKWFGKALKSDQADWSAQCDLADLLNQKGDSSGALEHYRKAFESAPSEPRTLLGYVTALVCEEGNSSCTTALRGALDAAIDENRRRVELHVDLPTAFLQIGRCHLFRGEVYPAFDAWCKASLACDSLDLIQAERRDIMAIVNSRKPPPEHSGAFEWASDLLDLLAVAVARRLGRAPQKEGFDRLAAIATQTDRPTFSKLPVVIVAGGCDNNVEERIATYRDALQGAFSHFAGTIICGGTTAGISGLLGEVASGRKGAIEAIGYLPPVEAMPKGDVRDEKNYRIAEVPAGANGYSPIGPIQTWADLLLAGVKPAEVRLLGINGGTISGFEFRLAMAVGATVGLIEDSGRAVSTLLTDLDWRELGRLAPLINERPTIASFVSAFCPTFEAIEDAAERLQKQEDLARAEHEKYRSSRLSRSDHVHPSILPWEGLHEAYKESNRQQVAYLDRILRTEGFGIVLSTDPREAVDLGEAQYKDKLNRMAQLEHGRFNAERLADGWRYGQERDLAAKTSPYLVPWNKLTPEVQGYDYEPFQKLKQLLADHGLKVVELM